MKRQTVIIAGAIFILAAGLLMGFIFLRPTARLSFDAQKAFELVKKQVDFGARIPGSAEHARMVEWLVGELKNAGWTVSANEVVSAGKPIKNVIATRGSGKPWIILGAHFDTRINADRDLDATKRRQPVPGANDGASGVAVLMELARVLPQPKGQLTLAFFDAEDQGDIAGWDWILGSRAFAAQLTDLPEAVVIIDMIGDANLNIYKEQSSTPALVEQIWAAAAEAGYSKFFLPQSKYRILDDHTPFLQKNIPSVDIIDFDYPYWHTIADTPDKVSPESFKAIGETLVRWLDARWQLAK